MSARADFETTAGASLSGNPSEVPSVDQAKADVRSRLAGREEIKARVVASETKRFTIGRRQAEMIAKRDAKRTALDKATARAAVAGETLPNQGGEQRELAQLESAVRGFPDEISDAEAELHLERAALRPAEARLYAARAVLVFALRAAISAEISETIGSVVPKLLDSSAALEALDQIQQEILGESFQIPDGMRDYVWRGAIVCANLFNNIPAQLRPASLDYEKVRSRIEPKRTELLTLINEV